MTDTPIALYAWAPYTLASALLLALIVGIMHYLILEHGGRKTHPAPARQNLAGSGGRPREVLRPIPYEYWLMAILTYIGRMTLHTPPSYIRIGQLSIILLAAVTYRLYKNLINTWLWLLVAESTQIVRRSTTAVLTTLCYLICFADMLFAIYETTAHTIVLSGAATEMAAEMVLLLLYSGLSFATRPIPNRDQAHTASSLQYHKIRHRRRSYRQWSIRHRNRTRRTAQTLGELVTRLGGVGGPRGYHPTPTNPEQTPPANATGQWEESPFDLGETSDSEGSSVSTDTNRDSEVDTATEASDSPDSPTISRRKADPTKITIVSANTRRAVTSRGSVIAVIGMAVTHKWDVICMQECLCPNMSIREQGYYAWSGAPIGASRMCNVTIVNMQRLKGVVPRRQISHPRIQVTDLAFKDLRISVLNVHRPYNGATQMSKGEFDPAFSFIRSNLDHDAVCVGDFNGELGLDEARGLGRVDKHFDKHLRTATNDASLVSLLNENGLRVANFQYTPHRSDPEKWGPTGATFQYHPGRKRLLKTNEMEPQQGWKWKTIDFITGPTHIVNRITELNRLKPLFGTSDHYAISCVIKAWGPQDQERKDTRTSTFAERIRKALPGAPSSYNSGKRQRTTTQQVGVRLQGKIHALIEDPDKNRKDLDKTRRKLKRLAKKLDSERWTNIARELVEATRRNDLNRTFEIVREAIESKGPKDKATLSDIKAAIREAEESLNQPTPMSTLDIQQHGETPESLRSTHESDRFIKAYTDGSRQRILSHKGKRAYRAGSAFWIPALQRYERCRVPADVPQTAPAGEVCAILLLLTHMRDLPPDTGLHIVSDNSYVVLVIENRLEDYLEQDFSNCAHAELWRAIAQELVSNPRPLKATWVRSHTKETDEDSIGNRIVDTHAKLAVWDPDTSNENPTCPPPQLRYEPVELAVRKGPPTKEEVRRAIRALNDTTPGPDGIAARELKDPACFEIIFDILARAWEDGRLPDDVVGSLCQFIPKKKKGAVRAINMTNTIVKVFENIVRTRLRVIPLLPCQHGFQRSRDCLGAIRTLLNAARSARSQGSGLYVVFLDFKDAYNSVRRDAIWTALRAHGVDENMISVLQSTHAGETEVKETGTTFHTSSGVYQGSCVAPALFNIALDCAIRASDLRTNMDRCIFYADDGVIFCRDRETAQDLLQSFTHAANALGLQLNLDKDKTEAMYILPQAHEQRWRKHSSPSYLKKNIGGLSNNPLSGTAHTRNGRDYYVDSSHTHLWCPLCTEGFQDNCTSVEKASSLLQRHFKQKHKDFTFHPFKSLVEFGRCKSLTEFGLSAIGPGGNTSQRPWLPDPAVAPEPAHPIVVVQTTWQGGQWRTQTQELRWTTKYKYLGQVVDNCASATTSIEERIHKANGSFHGLASLWAVPSLPSRLKTWILELTIYPILMYSMGTLCPSETDIRHMESSHRKWLSVTTGIRDPTVAELGGVVVPTPYLALCTIANTPPIREQLRTQRLLLAGRIERSSPGHPLRALKTDEWDATIDEDLAHLRSLPSMLSKRLKRVDRSTLSSKYHCHKLLHRPNTHL